MRGFGNLSPAAEQSGDCVVGGQQRQEVHNSHLPEQTHPDTYASGRPILLCLSSGDFCRRWVLEESPDAACYVALEAASDLAIGLAFGA